MKFPRSIRLPLAGLAAIAVCSGCGGNGNPVAPSPQLDTTPPPAPQDLSLGSVSGRPAMIWTASSAPDVAGYQVYQYEAVPGGYDFVPTGDVSVDNRFLLPTVSSPIEISYRVRAVDVAGNWSAYSATADIPIPACSPGGRCETE